MWDCERCDATGHSGANRAIKYSKKTCVFKRDVDGWLATRLPRQIADAPMILMRLNGKDMSDEDLARCAGCIVVVDRLRKWLLELLDHESPHANPAMIAEGGVLSEANLHAIQAGLADGAVARLPCLSLASILVMCLT